MYFFFVFAHSIIDLLANCTIFIFIGATAPFDDWNSEMLQITPWRLILLGIAIMTLRRLPAIIILYRFTPDIRNFQEALFCGHFGPMGMWFIQILFLKYILIFFILAIKALGRYLLLYVLKLNFNLVFSFTPHI